MAGNYKIRPYNPILLSEKMGAALMINNKNYTGDRLRKGSDMDVSKMKSLLEYLNFDVFVKQDLRAHEMRTEMENFIKLVQAMDVDMVTVVLMGHGSTDAIDGVDDRPLYFDDDVFKKFTNENCPAMMNKPKLFIIQSCRGDKQDSGFEAGPNICSVDGNGGSRLLNNLSPSVFKDYLIAFSTINDYASYRSDSEGSFFIADIVEIFNEEAHNIELQTLFKMVGFTVFAILT